MKSFISMGKYFVLYPLPQRDQTKIFEKRSVVMRLQSSTDDPSSCILKVLKFAQNGLGNTIQQIIAVN